MNTPPENILIYRLGSLGDTVIALPCFNRIRECYPEADITLLTNKPVTARAAPLQAVLGNDYFFDRILSYPVGTRNPFVINKLIRNIRRHRIDTVINITALRTRNAEVRDRLFFRAAGVSNFIGFDQTADDFKIAIDPATGQFEWEALRLKRKIKALGDFKLEDEKYWDLHLSDAEWHRAKKALGNEFDNSRLIAISPGTKMPVKHWGEKAWESLLQKLSSAYGDHTLVIVGAPDEANFGETCLKNWGGTGLNLCGKTNPRVSAAVLSKAKLFIGHDSGPTHLAACMGTPCVAIFSCINRPRQWFPKGKNNRILLPDTDCARNGLNRCSNPNGKCIETIDCKEVEQAVVELMDKTVEA